MQKLPKKLILIFLLALFLRIYRLNTFPLGLHVDEAKVAWNALSILKTLKDDHGNLFSLYYNSFGDYRPTGIFYITIPFIILFGKSIFAVRFASSLFGALTVFPVFFIAQKFNKKLGITASLILAIIPWHLATSRATSEVVISCFLILTSLVFLSKKPVLSFFLLAISFFFYHSARVMGPLLMVVWIIYLYQNHKLKLNKKIIFGFFITSLFSLILLFSKTGLARYNQVKLPSPNIRSLFINYSSYFDPNFFIGDISKPFRYRVESAGIVSIPIFICFLTGIYIILKTNKNRILILLFALGAIPASLTLEDSPNLHRAFFMLPFFVIITSLGIISLRESCKNIYKLLAISICISFLIFWTNYTKTQNNFAYEFRDPNIEDLVLYLGKVQPNYNKIFVTNDPDSPYPWYGFFDNMDPKIMNKNLQQEINGKWQFENIVWDNTKCPAASSFDEAKKDNSLTKILVVDNGNCYQEFDKTHPEAKIIKELEYNGKVNYRIWEYQPIRI